VVQSAKRDIPLTIKREVRQRCGFGCVICGIPLYEYEHMLGFAEVHRHVADEITLLCDQHHREKTSGLLPVEDVLKADKHPHNLRAGASAPYALHYAGPECEIDLGSNRFTTRDEGYGTIMCALAVDGTPLVGFILSDGQLLLNLNVFDEFNELILRIANNELVYSSSPWDIEFIGRRLIIREAQRDFLIEMEFVVPNKIVISRGRLLHNGVEIIIQPSHVLITNNHTLLSGNRVTDCPGGLTVGSRSGQFGSAIAITQVPRYLGDRSEAIRWARDAMSKSSSKA
jgi:trigger factor